MDEEIKIWESKSKYYKSRPLIKIKLFFCGNQRLAFKSFYDINGQKNKKFFNLKRYLTERSSGETYKKFIKNKFYISSINSFAKIIQFVLTQCVNTKVSGQLKITAHKQIQTL